MKRLLFFLAVFPVFICVAQAPEKMSYQAVIRDVNNNLVSNQIIGTQFSIIQGLPSGTPVYVETQTPLSNSNGLISLEIGTGQIVSGSFSSIDWANGPFYLKTDTDISGGTNYTISGTTQLLSVPYALYSKSAASADTANFAYTANTATNADTAFIAISAYTVDSANFAYTSNFANNVCPEDSMGLFSEVKDPIIPPTIALAGMPGIVDNRYYKYKYLLKKNNTRTKLSPESQSVQVINNTIDGQIDFSVMIPDESDIDSIVVYRQFSVGNIVYGLYSYVGSFPVTTNQVFSFTDNNDNFSITPNPQPLADTNNTFLKGIIKTDLLTEDREYQLPDESGTIALTSDNPVIPLSFSFNSTNQTVTVNHLVGKAPKMIYLNTFSTVSTPAISGSTIINDYPASYIKIGNSVVSSGSKPFQLAYLTNPNSNITSVTSDENTISVTVSGIGTFAFTVTGYAVF